MNGEFGTGGEIGKKGVYIAYHDSKIPDIYLRIPPHPQQHLWGSEQIRLDILVVRGNAEACLAEIAQHWSAVSLRNTELSRSINDTIPIDFMGTGVCLLRFFEI